MMPVFDIEAQNWVHPVAVGFYSGEEYKEFIKESEDDDVIWRFLLYLQENHPSIKLFAHAAADYDSKFIVKCLNNHNQTLKFAGGTTRILWEEPQIYFEDSYAVIGRGLDSCCKALEVDRKLDWSHLETQNPWEMPRERLDAFRAYMRRDCISLSNVLDKFFYMFLEKFGMMPSSTLSLTSVKVFDKRFFPLRDIDTNEKFEVFIREATFGGRNEVYKKYGENLNLYDIRLMYVSCYDVPMPVGRMEWTQSTDLIGTLAYARVKVPNTLYLGPLPYRSPEHNHRSIFPVGEWEGWYDMVLLRAAVSMGCDVEVKKQLICEERPVLKEFGEYVSRLREKSNQDLGKIWKLFGIRLSGKLGQNRERSEISHIAGIENLEGWSPLDENEVYHTKILQMNGHRSPFIKTLLNMRVRSEAMVRHLKLLANTDPYYCDTDSNITKRELPTGERTGELKLVDRADRAYFIHCKLYGYVTPKGAFKQKSSGFRDARLVESEFKRLLRGEEMKISFQSMPGWKETLTQDELAVIERHRTARIHLNFENRVSEGLDTRPIEVHHIGKEK